MGLAVAALTRGGRDWSRGGEMGPSGLAPAKGPFPLKDVNSKLSTLSSIAIESKSAHQT